eukprot:6482664-Alexandrium_andersonii.AAC.1
MGGARVGDCAGAQFLLNWAPTAVRSADLKKSGQRINFKAPRFRATFNGLEPPNSKRSRLRHSSTAVKHRVC